MRIGVIFLNDSAKTMREAEVELNNPSSNCLSITGLIAQEGGFELVNLANNHTHDYSMFSTIYKVDGETVYYSNDGSVYVEPESYIPCITFKGGRGGSVQDGAIQKVTNYADITIPNVEAYENYTFLGWSPEVPAEGEVIEDTLFVAQYSYEAPPMPLELVRDNKITEFNNTQQALIAYGTDIELSDGSIEHFTATEADQRSLAALQAQVMLGSEAIPWHNNDKLEGCKYYSNADMQKIIEGVTSYVTYHVTYFRDLRKMILLCEDREVINEMQYGMIIPEEYQSDVLKDIYAAMPPAIENEEEQNENDTELPNE